MRLMEYEYAIKSKVRENPSDPEIYNLLQVLSYYFLLRKKICRTSKDAEDISYIIAGDIFLRITEGEYFSYILGFLEKIYRGAVYSYYGDTSIISLDATDSPDLLLGTSSIAEYNMVLNKIYLSDILSVIDKVMEGSCKYRVDSSAYLNLKVSLLLSLIRGEVSGFHLTPDQLCYLKLIIPSFYNQIKKDGLGMSDEEIGGKSSSYEHDSN